MKKIAILSLYHRNYNYGGLLQAYALQKAVESFGHKCDQISYELMSGYPGYSPLKESVKGRLAPAYRYLRYGGWAHGYNKFRTKLDDFAARIPHTERVTAGTISSLKDRYDLFISGSDQIWNPTGYQKELFLDFLPDDVKRIAYAASIARDALNDEEAGFMGRYLPRYDFISVRESSTAEMLNRAFADLDVKCMPDPVFLLKEKDWEGLTVPCEPSQIFAYFLGDDEDNREKAKAYAKKNHMSISFVSHKDTHDRRWEVRNREYLAPVMGIGEFLYCIGNAGLVITDSFHASALSCILGTPFLAMPRFKDGDVSSMNSRLRDLTAALGIGERFGKELKEEFGFTGPEKAEIKSRIEDMRSEGLMFLKESIDKCLYPDDREGSS
ncbi:MAG: polysaccharide pyruvyl transferase family protein [Lachnospiraceae bacterium]|nr:polysaccharide pyruvyl transferase family protein [Lachnospiraceae bacterium]